MRAGPAGESAPRRGLRIEPSAPPQGGRGALGPAAGGPERKARAEGWGGLRIEPAAPPKGGRGARGPAAGGPEREAARHHHAMPRADAPRALAYAGPEDAAPLAPPYTGTAPTGRRSTPQETPYPFTLSTPDAAATCRTTPSSYCGKAEQIEETTETG